MFRKSRTPLALDIGTFAVKLVQLERGKQGLTLARLGMASLAPGAVEDGTVKDHEEVLRAVEELVSAEKTKAKEAVVSLSGSAALVRTIHIPRMAGPARDSAIDAEVAQILPFPPEEARITRQRLGRVLVEGEEMEEFLLVAVKRKPLKDLVELMRHMRLEPKIVDVNLLALESAVNLSGAIPPDEEDAIALVDIGASATLVHILRGRRTLMTRLIPYGGNSVTEKLTEVLAVGRSEAEAIKLGTKAPSSPRKAAESIREEVERIALELGRTFQLVGHANPGIRVGRIILSGGGAQLDGLPAFLAASLDIGVDISQPFRRVEVPEDKFDPDYVELLSPIATVGAGLAHRVVESA